MYSRVIESELQKMRQSRASEIRMKQIMGSKEK